MARKLVKTGGLEKKRMRIFFSGYNLIIKVTGIFLHL